MGLPCTHWIQELLRNQTILHLDNIHCHWYLLPLMPITVQPLILEPAVASVCGQPSAESAVPKSRSNRAKKARQAVTSTRRIPSAFEHIDVPSSRQKKVPSKASNSRCKRKREPET